MLYLLDRDPEDPNSLPTLHNDRTDAWQAGLDRGDTEPRVSPVRFHQDALASISRGWNGGALGGLLHHVVCRASSAEREAEQLDRLSREVEACTAARENEARLRAQLEERTRDHLRQVEIRLEQLERATGILSQLPDAKPALIVEAELPQGAAVTGRAEDGSEIFLCTDGEGYGGTGRFSVWLSRPEGYARLYLGTSLNEALATIDGVKA